MEAALCDDVLCWLTTVALVSPHPQVGGTDVADSSIRKRDDGARRRGEFRALMAESLV